MQLHDELQALVTAARPWGIEILTEDGQRGLIDNAKIPSWRDSGVTPAVGTEIKIVVLDETREPFRASAMPDDLEIGRRLRELGTTES